jgi:hypothetical protein
VTVPATLPALPSRLTYAAWRRERSLFTTETGIGKVLQRLEKAAFVNVGPALRSLEEAVKEGTLLRARAKRGGPGAPGDAELARAETALAALLAAARKEAKDVEALLVAARDTWVKLADWVKEKDALRTGTADYVVTMERVADDFHTRVSHVSARAGDAVRSAAGEIEKLKKAQL